MRKFGLKAQLAKCRFMLTEVVYLGFLISHRWTWLAPNPARVAALKQYKPCSSVREVRRLLEMASYFSRHVHNFAEKAHALYRLTKKEVAWRLVWLNNKALKALLKNFAVVAASVSRIYHGRIYSEPTLQVTGCRAYCHKCNVGKTHKDPIEVLLKQNTWRSF